MRTLKFALPLLVLLGAGCPYYVTQWQEVRPPFDHQFISKIGVVEFEDYTEKAGGGRILADRVEQLLVNESGYQVMTRMELYALLEEHNMSAKRVLSQATLQRLGQLAGIDAVVAGILESYELVEHQWPDLFLGPQCARTVTVTATFKVIQVTTGRVVWSTTVEGRASRSGPLGQVQAVGEHAMFNEALRPILDQARLMFPHRRQVQVLVNPWE